MKNYKDARIYQGIKQLNLNDEHFVEQSLNSINLFGPKKSDLEVFLFYLLEQIIELKKEVKELKEQFNPDKY